MYIKKISSKNYPAKYLRLQLYQLRISNILQAESGSTYRTATVAISFRVSRSLQLFAGR